MKTLIIIASLALTIVSSCQQAENNPIDCNGYRLGERVDTFWTVIIKDDETKFKYLQNQLDTNLRCRAVADTIWSMSKYIIDEAEVWTLISKMNTSFNTSSDCTHVSKVAGHWEGYQYNWADSITGDKIILLKLRMGEERDYRKWGIEILNYSLLDHLNSNHNPFYGIKPPPPVDEFSREWE